MLTHTLFILTYLCSKVVTQVDGHTFNSIQFKRKNEKNIFDNLSHTIICFFSPSVVCWQCPADASKSRRAAENDLLENTFSQVNQSIDKNESLADPWRLWRGGWWWSYVRPVSHVTLKAASVLTMGWGVPTRHTGFIVGHVARLQTGFHFSDTKTKPTLFGSVSELLFLPGTQTFVRDPANPLQHQTYFLLVFFLFHFYPWD